MLIVSHPTANNNTRELALALCETGQLREFHTCIAACGDNFFQQLSDLPGFSEIKRRACSDALYSYLRLHPWREIGRLGLGRLGIDFLNRHESGFFSVDALYRSFDKNVSKRVRKSKSSAVYCYEDGALETFRAAKKNGAKCIYDLPIAYWRVSRALIDEEAERLPSWRRTLVGTFDSAAKFARKEEELDLADMVVCPSHFVFDSIPERVRATKKICIIPFGSPSISQLLDSKKREPSSKLRILFAGSMTQRKGLADVFAAFKLLDPKKYELHVMGTPIANLAFYYNQFPNFIHHQTRSNEKVLELMRSCDVFVLPSIVEGRALVQQEAMSCGLPIIVTKNAGGEDLVEDGKAGFLVPIRSPEAIAEKLEILNRDRDLLETMRFSAKDKASQLTWASYRGKISKAVESLISAS
jgi:glycosyltransferase involved in cell wall biosynthesis